MHIEKNDLDPILEHINKRFPNRVGDNYIVKQLRSVINQTVGNLVPLVSLSYLYSKEMLQDGLLQNELLALGEKNGFSYPKFIESELQKNSWGGEKLIIYTKFIKEKIYYPENDNVILDIIKNNSYENNKKFKSLLTLSSLIKNDDNSCDAFAATMAKRSKYNPLATLDLEKIKRLFDKRFKGKDVTLLPPDSYNSLKDIFNRIEEKASTELIKEDSGYYYKISVDADAISQQQKLTVGKVSDGVRKLLSTFKYFTESDLEIVQKLSISKFSFDFSDLNNLQITLQYTNPDMKETLIPVFKELLVNGLTKGTDKDLKCVDILNSFDDTDEYYEKYFNSKILDNELSKKDVEKPKKMKI